MEKTRKKADVLTKSISQKSRLYDSFQEEIANTYLKTSGKKPKKAKRRVSLPNIPWVVTLVSLFFSFFIIFSKSNIDIKIKILSGLPFVNRETATDEFSGVWGKGIFFVKGGNANSDIVKKAFFVGDAQALSKVKSDEVILCNSRDRGWANYRLDLKKPIDLNKFDIKYTAKGKAGDERLILMIVDTNNRSYRIEDDLSSKLTDGWHTYSINFKPVGDVIDLANISAIRFEFGTLTAGNESQATIFLKDIYGAKAKGVKWL